MYIFARQLSHVPFTMLVLLTLLAMSRDALAADSEKATEPVLMLRISPSQYIQTITDIFGSAIKVNGQFEPEVRVDGLLAIGSRKASISDRGLESYDEIARSIAQQLMDPANRGTFVHCVPQSPSTRDDHCATLFVAAVGRLLYRRPLGAEELAKQVQVAGAATATLHDFYAGLATSLADMLVSPDFLFRRKHLEPDPAKSGMMRLDAYSKASVLSFFLWNASPDEVLLRSAESGEIHSRPGLQRQVDRMLSSPRIETGVRAFFSDMLGFNELDTLAKDATFFPRYTLNVRDESAEQTLRTIVDNLVTRHGDYRDLFITPHTFLTRSLAALYNVPLAERVQNGEPEHWLPYTYPSDDPRVGILAQASFVALHSPAGRSSPTGRGKALRELLLCQRVPPPPGNVDFSFVQDISNPEYKTTRSRLTAHRKEVMCAGCHRITDPIGLALENFDSSGAYRTTENGELIDASGDLNGVKFSGPLGLGQAVHDDVTTTACVAKKAFGFGAGRLPDVSDAEWQRIQEQFKESRYNFLELLRQIAMSDMLYRESGPPPTSLTAQQRPAGN
jgi:hypothetical protein